MHPRAAFLIERLGLKPHPEGGFYAEVFRSGSVVSTVPAGAQRSAITTIYFLLPEGQASRWHRVTADEVWHFYEGAPLELHMLDSALSSPQVINLGPVLEQTSPVSVVTAGTWQAARTTGEYTLVGCTVGPGFEFSDFMLLASDPGLCAIIEQRFPHLASLI